jgi:hypothetical protein
MRYKKQMPSRQRIITIVAEYSKREKEMMFGQGSVDEIDEIS